MFKSVQDRGMPYSRSTRFKASCRFKSDLRTLVLDHLQQPCLVERKKKHETLSCFSGRAVASGHLENKQETVMMYLFPFSVLVKAQSNQQQLCVTLHP